MQSENGLKTSQDNDFLVVLRAFDNSFVNKAPIPSRARLFLEKHSDIQVESENKKNDIIVPFSCCDAGRYWRAGVEVETLLQTAKLPCDKEKAEKCRRLWDAIEKVQLYEAQSAAAKQGSATMLRHLGEVRLGQVNAPVSDPGIGDIVFSDGEEKCENS